MPNSDSCLVSCSYMCVPKVLRSSIAQLPAMHALDSCDSEDIWILQAQFPPLNEYDSLLMAK